MSAQITLNAEFVSSNEICIRWNIPDHLSDGGRAFLFLNDINLTSSDNKQSTVFYQIKSNEFELGSHTFTGLNTGTHIAFITVNNDSVITKSSPIEFMVYKLDAPSFVSDAHVRLNQSLRIYLQPRVELDTDNSTSMTQGHVNFILFGQYVLEDVITTDSAGTIYVTKPYNSSNMYLIEGLQNNVEYEISCLYTNEYNCSSPMSSSILLRPSNTPNKITNLEPIYNSVTQTLKISHGMPNDLEEYVPLNCRATITTTNAGTETVFSTYNSNVNPAELLNSPSPSDDIIFNMTNQSLLPTDTVFKVTLAISNSDGLGEESDPIFCIHPQNYFSKPVLNENLNFSLTADNKLKIEETNTVANRYNVNSFYDIKYKSQVFKYVKTGSNFTRDVKIYEDAIYSIPTRILDLNLATDINISNYELGELYKYVLNVDYEKTLLGATRIPPHTVPLVPSVTIGPNVLDQCYFYFIPHTNPEPVTLSAQPNDESVTISWTNLTESELNGYQLHHYEYIIGDLTNETDINSLDWISVNKDITKTFNSLTNGDNYIFNVRAVSFSDNSLYGYDDRLVSTHSTITSNPYGTPETPLFVSRLPEDGKSTIVFTLEDVDPFNGGLLDHFETSIDNGEFSTFSPIYDEDTKHYTHVFNLSNDTLHTIKIQVITKNKLVPSLAKKNSSSLIKTTTPYAKPVLPTNFRAIPYTNTVDLSWTASNPSTIIGNSVKYEISYKLSTDAEYTDVSANPVLTSPYTVTGLTSNLSYDFRIRSLVKNDELSTVTDDVIIYSDNYSSSITSRPFIYSNKPNIQLVTGINGSTIDVKLSPNPNNYYNGKFNYYATIYEKTDLTKSRPKSSQSDNVQTTAVETLTLNTFNDGNTDVPDVDPSLIDFSLYRIVYYYQMFNTETGTFYSSEEGITVAFPFEPNDAPILSVVPTVVGVQSVTLSWTKPKLIGLNVVGYQILNNLGDDWRDISTQITQDGDTFTTVVSDYSDSVNPTITTIEPGTVYNFWIRAKIQEVTGEYLYSATSNMATAYPYNNPGKPISLLTTVLGNGELIIDWEQGTLGYLDLWSYQIKITPYVVTGAYLPTDEDVKISANRNLTNTHTFTGLTNGQIYTVSIRMITINTYENNKLITGEAEIISEIVYDLATAPANFSTYSSTNPVDTVQLTWDPVTGANLGGLIFVRYEVMLQGYNSDTWYPTGSDGADLSYNFTVSGDYINNTSQVIGQDGQQKYARRGQTYTYSVRVITKKSTDDSLINGYSSESINTPVGIPNVVTDASVDRKAGNIYYDLTNTSFTNTLSAVDGVLYMILSKIQEGISADYNGLWYSLDYTNNYEVSFNGGNNWLPVVSLGEISSQNGFHVFGGNFTEITSEVVNDSNIRKYNFISNGLITVGTEYQFCVRRYGYNLYNNITNLAAWGLAGCPDAQLGSRFYSAPSNIILNTSYHVSPQENYYDPVSTVYYANPLLGVTSTPSNGKITLSWNAADSSVLGGLVLNYYEVQLNDGSWTKVSDDTSITTYDFTLLTNGEEYIVSVRTNCSHTEKNITGTIITKVFTGTPVSKNNVPYVVASAPANLVKSYPGTERVLIVWDHVTGDNLGGLSLKKYQVSKDNGNSWTDVLSSVNEYVFTPLNNGTNYDIKVRAVTTYNDVTPSSVVLFDFSNIDGNSSSISAIPRSIPVATTILDIDEEDQQIILTWNYNTSTPGLLSFSTFKAASDSNNLINAITAESVAYSNLGANNTLGGNNFQFSFSGLTNGTKYNFKLIPVVVIQSTGELIEGTPLITRPFVPYVKASVPTALTTTPGDKQIKLEWNTVNNLGGLSLQKYQVSKDNGTTWNDVDDVDANVREYLFTELNNGTIYNMKVRAVTEFIDTDPLVKFANIEGNSASASATPFVKPGTASSIITSVVNNLFTFSFTAPANANNNVITEYYEYSIDEGDNWVSIYLNAPWPNLTVGDNIFSFKIRVYILNPNNITNNIYGDTITINNLKNIDVTTPENLIATVGNKFITLSWKPIINMSYQVILYGLSSNTTAITNSSSYTFSGLNNGAEYNLGVTMYVNGEPGPASNISATPMTEPSITSISKSGNFLNIYVDYGGSSVVNVIADSSVSTVEDSIRYINANSIVSNNIVDASSNPITFQVDNITQNDTYTRNYFDIIITNSVGNFSGKYTL
jgi:hypothetical protein